MGVLVRAAEHKVAERVWRRLPVHDKEECDERQDGC